MERESEKEFIRWQAVSLFTKVRDIPYKLGLDGDPRKLLSGGNCVRKILHLAPDLDWFGYKLTGIGVAVFDWREFDIPKEIIGKLKNPIDTHVFAYLNNLLGEEIMIDPAWDAGMPKTFPKSIWDGEHPTIIGVTPLSLRREKLDSFKTRVSRSIAAGNIRTLMHLKRETPFNDAFNVWLGR